MDQADSGTTRQSRPESVARQRRNTSRACGLVFCYNEEQILGECLEYYLAQEIDLVVVDNYSTDSSPAIAEQIRQRKTRHSGRIRDLVRVQTNGYEWKTILRFACDYMHEHLSTYDWILLIDADAFYQSPVREMALLDFLQSAAGAGYNTLEGAVYDFYPTEKDDPAVLSHTRRLKYCDPSPLSSLDDQQKIFRYHKSIDFTTGYGHRCVRQAPRVFPLPFIYKHYCWVSLEHGLRKVFADRKPRYVERKTDPDLHWHYLHLLPSKRDLVKRADELWLYDDRVVQISARRFHWILGLRAPLELYAFVRKPVRRSLRRLRTRLKTLRHSPQPWSLVSRISAEHLVYRFSAVLNGYSSSLLNSRLNPLQWSAKGRLAFDKARAFHASREAEPGAAPAVPHVFSMVRARDLMRENPVPAGFPRTIHFLLTNYCNARCVFCNQDFVSGNHAQLTLEAFKAMTRHIPAYLGCQFTFSGGGEPLLCRDLTSLIRFTNESLPWVRTTLCTNGMLLGRRAKELAETQLDRIDISVHGATGHSNRRILQMSGQEDVFEAVERLKQRLKAAGRRTKIRLRPAVSQLNIDEIPGLVKKAAHLEIEEVEVNFMRFYPWHAYKGKHGQRAREKDSLYYDQGRYNEVIRESRSLAGSLGVRFMHEPLFGSGFKARPCPEPWMTLVVNFDGTVFPCSGGEIWFGKKVRQGEHRFGNLLQQHLTDIWNSDSFVAVRRTCSSSTEILVPECVSCHNLACFRGPESEEAHIIKKPFPGWEA